MLPLCLAGKWESTLRNEKRAVFKHSDPEGSTTRSLFLDRLGSGTDEVWEAAWDSLLYPSLALGTFIVIFFLVFFTFSKIVFVVFHLNFCSFPHAVVASVNSSPRKLLFQDNFVSRGQIKSSSFIGPCIHMQPMLAGPCSL